jgi:hypothetical protein
MATGISSSASASAFHEDNPEQISEYRSLSVLAVVGLVLGLVSPVCFGAPLLMIVPIAGIAISLLALRQIAVSDGALAGRWVATLGLVLSVVFAVAPPARAAVIRTMRSRQAETFSREWISTVLAGQADRAFRLTSDSTRPPSPPEPGQTAAKPSPFDTFKQMPIVAALLAAGPDADVRFMGTNSYDMQSFHRVFVQQRFEITPKSAGPDIKPINLLITLLRTKLSTEGRARWLVYSVEDGNRVANPVPSS